LLPSWNFQGDLAFPRGLGASELDFEAGLHDDGSMPGKTLQGSFPLYF
jgi:hypothetical protein